MSKDEQITQAIFKAFNAVGRDGLIRILDGQSTDVQVEIIEDFYFDSGYLSQDDITDPVNKLAILENPYVLLIDKCITDVSELEPVINELASAKEASSWWIFKSKSKSKPSLLIIADDFAEGVTANLAIRFKQQLSNVVAVKLPLCSPLDKISLIYDIAALTNNRIINSPDKLNVSSLGRAKKVIVGNKSTSLVRADFSNPQLIPRVMEIQSELNDESRSDEDRNKLRERLSKLAGGIAIIRLNSSSALESQKDKARIEKTVAIVRSAISANQLQTEDDLLECIRAGLISNSVESC